MTATAPIVAENIIKKTLLFVEDIHIEGGKKVDKPLRIVTSAAVVENPWAGRGFVQDLQPEIKSIAPAVADLLVKAMLPLLDPSSVEAYGKAAVVGSFGEIEHASALIHTLRFGDVLRRAVDGSSFLPFTNKRGGPGCLINIPMKNKNKDQEGSRAHFLTAEIAVPDAPGPDEIVLAISVASGGRPHSRIGDRYQDMKELAAGG